MISTTQWRDLIQKDTRLTRTNVVFDGTDLSDYLISYELTDTLDQDGKASVYGMIAVKTIAITLLGKHPKYDKVSISHYVEYNGSSETFTYGTFKLNEPIYDEKSNETTFTIWQDNYDETVLAPIVGATSPQDYMSKQSVIDVDSSEWTLGDTVEVVDSGTAFYETYKEMAMDMALCTSSFGIKRSDQLVYRNFTEVDYMLEYLFEVEIGETMLPINKLVLATDLGDNISDKTQNLIKDDFSDFTAYQGATVTKNKTFPINMFKGGRNLLLDSKGTIDLTKLTWEPFEYNTWEEIGE